MSKSLNNEMTLEFEARSENESLARMAIAAFIMPLDPTLEELSDVKTAVSEAVTNAIIHGYEKYATNYSQEETGKKKKQNKQEITATAQEKVIMNAKIMGDLITIHIVDHGRGIADVEKAMEPLYSSRPDLDRAGMGFSFMEAFMDDLEVVSEVGKGTDVQMSKKIGSSAWISDGE